MTDKAEYARVPLKDMEPLERLAHQAGADVHGLKCDTKDCGWRDDTIPVDAFANHLRSSCPECGAPLLTANDFIRVMTMVFAAAGASYTLREFAAAVNKD